jgi:hypothetical protein
VTFYNHLGNLVFHFVILLMVLLFDGMIMLISAEIYGRILIAGIFIGLERFMLPWRAVKTSGRLLISTSIGYLFRSRSPCILVYLFKR